MSRIAIIGAGAWGTALTVSFSRNRENQIALWSHSQAVADALHEKRENPMFLPGFRVPEHVRVTADLAEALTGAEVVVSAVPSHHTRHVLGEMLPHLARGQVIVSASKGIENDRHLRMSEVIAQTLGPLQPVIGVLSGPSFAQEVAAGNPTAITLACAHRETARALQNAFSSAAMRIYTSDDIIGVEMGGALKNVIAIASGIVTGLELGTNSAAALITRGLAEITRLAVACGGRGETLAGLSGLGDLVLTCTGGLSRNRTVGIALGRGETLPEIVASLHGKVAEGIRTTRAAQGLAGKHGVEMPILEQVAAILYDDKSPRIAMRDLLARPGREE
jgi:glycerol-3-phosphate dehydrogenase (NAD(P)+)